MATTELGILFLHHHIDEVVENNLASVRRHNPRVPVATISATNALPKGYTLTATPEIGELHAVNPQRSSDWLVCSWFVQRKERCKKWWIVEWDTFCAVSVRDYYKPIWHYPFVASSVRLRHREHAWWWFNEIEKLPEVYRPYAVGASPFLYLVDDVLLQKVCAALLDQPFTAGNGELRFATVANKCGFPPCAFSPPNDQISSLDWEKLADLKMIFHPVKRLPEGK